MIRTDLGWDERGYHCCCGMVEKWLIDVEADVTVCVEVEACLTELAGKATRPHWSPPRRERRPALNFPSSHCNTARYGFTTRSSDQLLAYCPPGHLATHTSSRTVGVLQPELRQHRSASDDITFRQTGLQGRASLDVAVDPIRKCRRGSAKTSAGLRRRDGLANIVRTTTWRTMRPSADARRRNFSPIPMRVMDGSEPGDTTPAAVLSGAPLDLQARTVRYAFQPLLLGKSSY